MIAKGKKMTTKASLVLETIKKSKNKGGMTALQIALAEAQSEDYADMKQEIKGLKDDVSEIRSDIVNLKTDMSAVLGKLEILVEQSRLKGKLIENKYFWLFLIVTVMLIAGVSITDLKGIIN